MNNHALLVEGCRLIIMMDLVLAAERKHMKKRYDEIRTTLGVKRLKNAPGFKAAFAQASKEVK